MLAYRAHVLLWSTFDTHIDDPSHALRGTVELSQATGSAKRYSAAWYHVSSERVLIRQHAGPRTAHRDIGIFRFSPSAHVSDRQKDNAGKDY